MLKFAGMLIHIHPDNPQPKHIQQAVDCLQAGGLIIFPTDTIYAIGCDSSQIKAIESLAKLCGKELEHAHFSFIFRDLSHISSYTRPFNTTVYKLLKKALPGPYTFILGADNKVPARFFGPKNKNKTIGIRVPDNKIAMALVETLGRPLVSASVHDDDEVIEYTTDPELIHERYEGKVDLVIDGGFGDNHPSTVIDCSDEEPVVIREGKGSLEIL